MTDRAPLQSISIPRFESRTLPTPHTVYAVLISLPVRSWTVYRRYSEFVTLHSTFATSSSFPGPPPAPLPPKHAARRTFKVITGLGGLMPQSENIREAEESVLQERKQGLEAYLRAILASPESAWRESEEFRAFIELPKGQSTATVLGVQGGAVSSAPGKGRYVPGSYAASSNPIHERHIHGNNPATNGTDGGIPTRTLGSKQPLQESDLTRTLDDRGLMSSQKCQMDAQDRQLDGLAAVLRRQKAMGLAINQELGEQADLLDDLDQNVDQTQNKMRGAERQMDKLR